MRETQAKGITLIALVVTIVVLLILSGITINMLFGSDGIFNIANQAKEQYEIGAVKDRINNVIADWSIERLTQTGVTVDDLWDKMVDEEIITDPETDVEGPTKEGENDVYEVTTNDGYVVEVIVSPDGNVTIGDAVKGDKLPPKIVSVETTSETNNIQITVTMSRWENGIISYYYKKDGEADSNYKPYKEGVTELTANIEGLEQNEVYNIKIVAENENGSTEKVVNERTGELKTGTISQVGETIWSNGTASIELETTETGVTIQYQIDGTEGQWIDYEGPITGLNHGETVFAVITDGTNQSGYTTINILDQEAPTVTVTQGTVTTNSIQVNVNSSDAEWGIPESIIYNYYIKQTSAGSYPQDPDHTGTETSYTFTGLTQGTSYDVKVTTQDKAGNPGEGQATNITTNTVGGASEDLKEGNILATDPTWSNGTASITLSKGAGVTSNLRIAYQIGGIAEGNWTTAQEGANSVTVTGLNHNETVYARLTDGVNVGSYASVTIKDETAPNAPTISLSGTSGTNSYYKSNVTIIITAGNDGQSGANQVRYSVSGVQAISQTTTTEGITTTSITISTEGTSTITAYTIDKAGNVSIAKTQVVNKDSTVPSTASLTIESVGETSIAVTANGADDTSGIYSYQFQRSTSSSTSGFTTVATRTSTATSYSYTYTGLTNGTTYYLRVIVTDRAGNTKTGTAVTQATEHKKAENVLEEGDYVIYPSSKGDLNCRVLYDNSSEYGLQIIAINIVNYVKLGNDIGEHTSADEESFEVAMNSYNNAIDILNSAANEYNNNIYSSRARCVGSHPTDISDDPGYYHNNSIYNFYKYNGKLKNGDNNYEIDEEQIISLRLGIQGTYWMASRLVDESEKACAFHIRVAGSAWPLCYADTSLYSPYSESYSYGLLPVFILNSGINITGGTGTAYSPYTLGT